MSELFAGRYELIDPVGHGGAGTVWRVWDHRRRTYVAAKVLRHGDAGSVLRFVREQSLRVEHRNVVAPAGWAADDDRVLLTMDLVQGGSVHDLLADFGALPVPFVVVVLDQLLDALAAVHGHGIVHRDVKPANLLLAATGRGRPVVRLSDFGIAVVMGEPRLTEDSRVLGTPGYTPPEAMLGADPESRQDLYLAGTVAIEMLTGVRPEPGALPERPAHVPAELWALVERLAAVEPEDRPASASDARDELAAVGIAWVEPRADDPDAVEVFDHAGPLPEGYGPAGPVGTTPAAAPAQSVPTAAAAAPTQVQSGVSFGSYPPTAALQPTTPGQSIRGRVLVAGAALAVGVLLIVLALTGTL